MRVLDLFSGIGGFSLGLERAGMQTVAFCEVDEAARKVLRKHWPEVPIYEDVKTLRCEDVGSIDVICGGFPCQDISLAGKGAGLAGERSGLWFEMHRLIQEIRPSWVIAENVSALRSRGLDQVLRSLAEIGYDAEWHCIPACFVGAWHKRDRIWILAYPNSKLQERGRQEQIFRQSDLSRELSRGFEKWPGRSNLPSSRFYRRTDGIPGWMDRIGQLGNAVVPQIPELIGRAIMEASVAKR